MLKSENVSFAMYPLDILHPLKSGSQGTKVMVSIMLISYNAVQLLQMYLQRSTPRSKILLSILPLPLLYRRHLHRLRWRTG